MSESAQGQPDAGELRSDESETIRRPFPTDWCPFCLSPVPVGARLCLACKSDLSWRRYLSFSNTSLALITALISVIAISVPVVKSMRTPNDAVVHLAMIQAPIFPPKVESDGSLTPQISNKLIVLATNSGKQDGILVPTEFMVQWGPQTQFGLNTGLNTEDQLPVFIKPGEARLLTVIPGTIVTPHQGTSAQDAMTMLETVGWQTSAKCTADFVTVDTQGNRTLTQAEDNCSRVTMLVVNMIQSGMRTSH